MGTVELLSPSDAGDEVERAGAREGVGASPPRTRRRPETEPEQAWAETLRGGSPQRVEVFVAPKPAPVRAAAPGTGMSKLKKQKL